MKAIGTEFNIRRKTVPAAKQRLNVSVRGHGADRARTGIGNVKLVGTETI
jgi:hypothetical protein